MKEKSSKIWFFVGLVAGFISSRFLPEELSSMMEIMIIVGLAVYGLNSVLQNPKSNEEK